MFEGGLNESRSRNTKGGGERVGEEERGWNLLTMDDGLKFSRLVLGSVRWGMRWTWTFSFFKRLPDDRGDGGDSCLVVASVCTSQRNEPLESSRNTASLQSLLLFSFPSRRVSIDERTRRKKTYDVCPSTENYPRRRMVKNDRVDQTGTRVRNCPLRDWPSLWRSCVSFPQKYGKRKKRSEDTFAREKLQKLKRLWSRRFKFAIFSRYFVFNFERSTRQIFTTRSSVTSSRFDKMTGENRRASFKGLIQREDFDL